MGTRHNAGTADAAGLIHEPSDGSMPAHRPPGAPAFPGGIMRPEVVEAIVKAMAAAAKAGSEIGRLPNGGNEAILARTAILNAFAIAYSETRFGSEQACDCSGSGGVACAGCEDRTLGPRRCLDEVPAEN